MNAVIPKKRRDGKSSFEDLVSYVSVRDDMTDEELDLSSSSQAEQPHRSRFSRLVDYATRLRNESFVALVDVMKDGCEWVNFYGVTCFHNCTSLETAAADMEYIARQAHYAKMTLTLFFTTSFPGSHMKARVRNRFMTVYVIR